MTVRIVVTQFIFKMKGSQQNIGNIGTAFTNLTDGLGVLRSALNANARIQNLKS
jgi:hypothetical protein